jgi:rare lipoprotein A
MYRTFLLAALCGFLLTGGASAQSGMASFYKHGGRTASGEMVNHGAMTAAHRSLPFGTRVRVTDTASGNSVVVRINDRGPFSGGRIIDLSHGAAQALGITARGVARVRIEVVSN